MKKVISALAILAFTTSVNAGTLVYTPEVQPDIIAEEAGPLGSGSGAWLIPLIVLALIALAASGTSNGAQLNNGSNGPLNFSSNGIFP